MSTYCESTGSSSSDIDEFDHGIIDQVAPTNGPTNPYEIAFREALIRVCFLGAEAARVRGVLLTLTTACAFERSFYTRQWYFIIHYHRLWCDELSRTSAEFLRVVMTI